MSPRLVVGGRSDVGLQRRNNQDSLYAGPHLAAVADGIGGAAGGEVASRLTIDAIRSLDTDPTDNPDPGRTLQSAAERAVDAIGDAIARDGALTNMGTTLTALLATDGALTLAHIGDSRAYVLRGGTLTQLTHDHTLVQSLIDEGQITPAEALTHPRRSWILRALDARLNPDLDVTAVETQPGDRYLVCSDGLSSYVEESAITLALAGGEPQAAADRLLDLALRAGGPDNISCVVADLADNTASGAPPILAGSVAEAPLEPPRTAQPTTSELDPPTTLTSSTPAAAPPAAAPAEPVVTDRDDDVAPTARKRSIGKRLAAIAVLVVVLIVAASVAVTIDIHHRWYVAPAAGKVAVYRGVKGKAVGHKLSKVEQVTNIPVTALPQAFRDTIPSGLDASSRDKADAIVASLRTQACAQVTPTLSPSPSGTASAGSTASSTTSTPVWCQGSS